MFPILLSVSTIQAEVIVDGSLDGKGSQNIPGLVYDIHEGLGKRVGANLFHSFSQFNIKTQEVANFTTAAPADNILVRVTGGQESVIDGVISSPTNLWLMNPAGWAFKQNSQVNVQGAFHLSTADGIGFSNGDMFYADLSSDSRLTVSAPVDYQFKAGHQAEITLEKADLVMHNDGQTISVVGGDIRMTNSKISAPGGNILLASNSGQGKLYIDETGAAQTTGSMGTIKIEHNLVDQGKYIANITSPSLASSKIVPGKNPGTSAGTIQILAQQINMTNAYIVGHGFDNKNAGDTTLRADHIHMVNSSIDHSVQGSKNGGAVRIDAGNLVMENSTRITTNTTKNGGLGGNIDIDLKGRLFMTDHSSITSEALGDNSAGNIEIDSDSMVMSEGATVRSNTQQANSSAGNVDITTNQLVLQNNAAIDASTTSTSNENAGLEGQGGKISIKGGNILLTNNSSITSENFSKGETGNISIDINGLLKVQQDSEISTKSTAADGGKIDIRSHGVALQHSQIITSVENVNEGSANGDGGDIDIKTDTLILNGGFIQANTDGKGAKAGVIKINAINTIASQGSILKNSEERHIFSPDSSQNVIQAAAPDGVEPIELSTVELNIAGQLAKIDSDIVPEKTIVNNPCRVARDEKMSSLIQTGRGGLAEKASDQINLPLYRHLSKDNLSSQSNDNLASQQSDIIARDDCKQSLYE